MKHFSVILSFVTICCLQTFYAPGSNDRGHIVFVLSVCLSVVNFNLRYNFWTVRDRDFIFGMHTPLMTLIQMTPRSMTLWPWLLTLKLKIAFLTLLPPGAYCSVSQTHLDFVHFLLLETAAVMIWSWQNIWQEANTVGQASLKFDLDPPTQQLQWALFFQDALQSARKDGVLLQSTMPCAPIYKIDEAPLSTHVQDVSMLSVPACTVNNLYLQVFYFWDIWENDTFPNIKQCKISHAFTYKMKSRNRISAKLHKISTLYWNSDQNIEWTQFSHKTV